MEGKAPKSSGLGKILVWFVQSILSDTQSAQCPGTWGLLFSVPLLSLYLPVV